MTYTETIEYLYNTAPLFQHVGGDAYKEGLSNTHMLDHHFGHPHHKFRSIHVAGTNGKGSCAHTLAAMLQLHGYKVGLYTSPHLIDFRERIRINGQMIPEQYVVDFVEHERNFFEPLHPSFFELTTALAFNYFAECGVDVAVIEVGLGGRLDCTNIITPELSVITNISLDHTQFLGNTLQQIAREKAGIIKPGIPVVVGEVLPETLPIFTEEAQIQQADLHLAESDPEVYASTITKSGMRHYTTHSFGEFDGELTGECQIKNTNTLLCAAKQLNKIFGITLDEVCRAFSVVCDLTGLQGRWQHLQYQPEVVCDTGHNTGGWVYLSQQLAAAAQTHKHLHVVFGMATDKDVEKVIAMLPAQAVYYWTRASVHRAMDERQVAQLAAKHKLQGNVYNNVPEAYQAALQTAEPDDFIYIGGSSFIVADLLTWLKK